VSRWLAYCAVLLAGAAFAGTEASGDPAEEQWSLLEFLGSFDTEPEVFSEFFDSVSPQAEGQGGPGPGQGAAAEGEK